MGRPPRLHTRPPPHRTLARRALTGPDAIAGPSPESIVRRNMESASDKHANPSNMAAPPGSFGCTVRPRVSGSWLLDGPQTQRGGVSSYEGVDLFVVIGCALRSPHPRTGRLVGVMIGCAASIDGSAGMTVAVGIGQNRIGRLPSSRATTLAERSSGSRDTNLFRV